MFSLRQHIHDQTNHGLLVGRVRLSNQQRKRRQSNIIDNRRSLWIQQAAITIEKINKQKGGTAFIAISKWVIFDDEIE